MSWNLVDTLSNSGHQRKFFLPVAAYASGDNKAYKVDKNMFDIAESQAVSPVKDSTADIALSIHIKLPKRRAFRQNDLPHPAVRLYTIGDGRISFAPRRGSMRDSVVLQLSSSKVSTLKSNWWQRWLEGRCIPGEVVYENVDKVHLAKVLRSMPTTNCKLSFPTHIDQTSKSTFISRFMAGNPSYYLRSKAGAYIGCAAPDPEACNTSGCTRLIRMHVRYQDNTSEAPRPMNPREFFHLLFGNDSQEALNHPLLRRIDEIGQRQTSKHPASRRFLLRPPLRTWARVIWEAEQELFHYKNSWAPYGRLGTDRFYNDCTLQNRSFDSDTYAMYHKCNLFVSDICLRSGFRVCIHPVGLRSWHYANANSYANLTHIARGEEDRVPLKGSGRAAKVTWAWKVDNLLRKQSRHDISQFLNHAMQHEGRCFILACARQREFVPRLPSSREQRVNNSALSRAGKGTGHIVIVKEVLEELELAEKIGHGLNRISLVTMEASKSGAISRNYVAAIGDIYNDVSSDQGFIRIHLLELHPGMDPDTRQGLRDLNVENTNLDLVGEQ